MKNNLFYLDIETSCNYPNWNEFKHNDERGSKLFQSKYQKMGWEDKYKSIEIAYKEQGSIISTYGRIVCISCGFIDLNGNNQIHSFTGDEKDIVESFNELMKKIEKKDYNLCGFRIINFDIPYILHKLHKWEIKPANILITYNKKPWEMRVVDISEDWKGKFAWSPSFDEVCYELNINSPKDKIDGSMINKLYWEEKYDDIKNYCENDVIACIEVTKKIY